MEQPPELPPKAPAPLGKAFVFTLLAPVAGIVVASAIPAVEGASDRGVALWLLMLPIMFICSIVCSVWIGQRNGAVFGLLSFLGIQAFYIAVAFAGCIAVAPKI